MPTSADICFDVSNISFSQRRSLSCKHVLVLEDLSSFSYKSQIPMYRGEGPRRGKEARRERVVGGKITNHDEICSQNSNPLLRNDNCFDHMQGRRALPFRKGILDETRGDLPRHKTTTHPLNPPLLIERGTRLLERSASSQTIPSRPPLSLSRERGVRGDRVVV